MHIKKKKKSYHDLTLYNLAVIKNYTTTGAMLETKTNKMMERE